MAQTKETNLQETKEKLKQVANHWIELQELSKSAIYDISDPNINWNKEVKIADIESIDEKTKVEDSKPEKKSEEPPKKPKQKNNILSVIMFILSSSIYIVSWILLSIADNCREYLDGQNSIPFMLSRFITIIAIIIFTIGLVLLDKIATTKKCKKIISQNNIEITKKEQKFIDKFSKKYVSILSTTFMCICPVLLCACINIGSYGLNTMLECILSFFSIAVIGLGVVLIFKHKTKFLLDQLNYKVALNEIEENKKYNVEQLPILLKEYEDKVNSARQSYVDNINQTHRKIADIYNQIDKIDIVSKSQAKYAQPLLDCIYKGAESIKEAFQMLESNNHSTNENVENGETHYFTEYEALSDEEKKPYIDNAMRDWIELILKDPNLSRERKALLKYSIDNNEFHLEDLTDREKENVLMQAHLDYVHEHEDKDKLQPTQTKNCSIPNPQITAKITHEQSKIESTKPTINKENKPVKNKNHRTKKRFYLDIKNKEIRDKFDSYDTICEEYYQLPKRLQEKYVKIAIRDLMNVIKMESGDKAPFQYIEERLKDFDFNKLQTDEEKRLVIFYINNDVFEKHVRDITYKKSTRYKMDIATNVLGWFGLGSLAILLLVGIIISLCSGHAGGLGLPIAVLFIEFPIVWIPWFLILGFKFKWCAKCGHKLMLTGITSENERIESRRELYTGHTPWLINNGHLSYDKNGTPFIDSIETVHDETQHFKCPACGFVSQAKWKGVKKYN